MLWSLFLKQLRSYTASRRLLLPTLAVSSSSEVLRRAASLLVSRWWTLLRFVLVWATWNSSLRMLRKSFVEVLVTVCLILQNQIRQLGNPFEQININNGQLPLPLTTLIGNCQYQGQETASKASPSPNLKVEGISWVDSSIVTGANFCYEITSLHQRILGGPQEGCDGLVGFLFLNFVLHAFNQHDLLRIYLVLVGHLDIFPGPQYVCQAIHNYLRSWVVLIEWGYRK